MIDKNANIEIVAAQNGFVVWHGYRPERANLSVSMDDVLVFQTMTELCLFLHGHFNHRCQEVLLDKNPPVDADL